MKLQGKTVVITGASSGIGRELALQFSAKKSNVVLAARNTAALNEVQAEISKRGGQSLAVTTDVSVRSQVDRLVKSAVERFGAVDIFINNAGITHPHAPLDELSEEDVRRVIETNFMASLYSVWAAVPIMKKQGGGQLVFVSSVIGKRGIPKNSIYCATKFALQGLTEAIRLELADSNIHVIASYPPGVDTNFFINNKRSEARTFKLHPVDKIARLIVQACEKDARDARLTWDGKLMAALNYFTPGLLDRGVRMNKGI